MRTVCHAAALALTFMASKTRCLKTPRAYFFGDRKVTPAQYAYLKSLPKQPAPKSAPDPNPVIHLTSEQYRTEYLRSAHWAKLRKVVLDRDPVCRLCDTLPSTDPHHLQYRNLYDVLPDDLIGVCRDCHNLIHHHVYHNEVSTLTKLKKLLHVRRSRVALTDEFVRSIEASSVNTILAAKGLLKVVDLRHAVGKKISCEMGGKLRSLLANALPPLMKKRRKFRAF